MHVETHETLARIVRIVLAIGVTYEYFQVSAEFLLQGYARIMFHKLRHLVLASCSAIRD